MTENARTMVEEGRQLYSRLSKVVEHVNDLGTHLGRVLDAFSQLAGSFWRRYLPGAGRFLDRGIAADELPPLTRPDGAPGPARRGCNAVMPTKCQDTAIREALPTN